MSEAFPNHSLPASRDQKRAPIVGAERLAILRKTSGSWSAEDADIIEKAIEENCEKIEARDW